MIVISYQTEEENISTCLKGIKEDMVTMLHQIEYHQICEKVGKYDRNEKN